MSALSTKCHFLRIEQMINLSNPPVSSPKMFFVYDRLVERRQRLILRKAEQTNAIVSSLFVSILGLR